MKNSRGWVFFLGIMGLGLVLVSGCASQGDGRGAGLSGRRSDVVLAGLSQIGTPYVYGGTDPGKGLDCSGLTYYAHHIAGVQIPRVSTEQRKAARPVSSRHPRPGDMVFFQIRPGVHHVGLMVDNEHFVHASTSKQKVRLDRLDSSYWQVRYLGAGTYLE